jgi:hypothetical protein
LIRLRSVTFLLTLGWIVILAATLSACAGFNTRTPMVFRSGVPSTFQWAAGGREFPVEVVGNPFPLPDPVFAQAVVDAMQGANQVVPTTFTVRPGQSSRPGYRHVFMFGAPLSLDAHTLCNRPGDLPAPVFKNRLTVIAAFCSPSQVLSEVTAIGPLPRSPADPAFRQLVAAVTYDLVPLRDPFDDNDRFRCPLRNC